MYMYKNSIYNVNMMKYMLFDSSALYGKNYNISRTKSHKLNDYHHILHLYLPNPLEPGIKSWMKI